jgi:hypothetical protein
VPVFVMQEQRYHPAELVRQPDGQFSTVPLGATYEDVDDDVRQYVFPSADGTARVVTYERYDFVECDTDPHERGLRATVWSDRPLGAEERARVVAALTAATLPPKATAPADDS